MLTGDAAELAERVKARRDADDPKIDWLVVIFWTIIIALVHLGDLAEHAAPGLWATEADLCSFPARAGAAVAAGGAAGAGAAVSPAAAEASAAAAPPAAGRST